MAIVYSHVRSELRPSKRAMAAPGAQQRVLHGVLGVVDRAEHAVAVGVEQAAVGLDEPGEGVLVAPAGGVEQLALRHAAPHPLVPRLGLPEGDLAALGRRHHAAPPAGPSRGSSSTRGAEPAGAIGDLVDAVDLDVGQPHRAARRALDDAAPEGAAQRQRVVAGAAGVDPLGAPAQQIRVERARALAVAGVQLEVDDGMRAHPAASAPSSR